MNRDSAPENQSEDESHAESGKDRLGRIFANVLFGVVLERSRASSGIVPRFLGPAAGIGPSLLCFATNLVQGVLGLAAILAGNRFSRASQILGRFACVHFAALEFVLRIRRARRSM